jgi:hypothetical protein
MAAATGGSNIAASLARLDEAEAILAHAGLDPADRQLLGSDRPLHPTASVFIVQVTPEIAQRWLLRNERNRKSSKSLGLRYGDQMLSGLWQLVPDCVAFYIDGTLANGQHRLEQVKKTGVAQWLGVMFGLPEESRLSIDNGKRRTLHDFLYMEDIFRDRQADSLLRYILYLAYVWNGRMTGFGDARGQPAIPELLAFARAHVQVDPVTGQRINLLLPSLTMGRRMQLSVARLSVATAGALHYHFAQMHGLEVADEFFELVDKGLNLPSTSDPIFRLRKILLTNDEGPRGWPAETLAAFVIKAFLFWRAGDRVKTLRWARADEPFPRLDGKPGRKTRERRDALAAAGIEGAAPVASGSNTGGI